MSVGRPRTFDEDQVLEAAGRLFWSKGFEATSTRELTKQTGLTPSSIYAAFGDKRGLCLRVIDHYIRHHVQDPIARLEDAHSPARAISAYFAEILDFSLADPEHRGCMAVNMALDVTANDPELTRPVAEGTRIIERFFERNLAAAQATGEIAAILPPADLAKHLLAALLGLRVLARIRPERGLLVGLVGAALAGAGLPALVDLLQA